MNAYGGSFAQSTAIGDSVSFSFTGDQFNFLYKIDGYGGILDVYVDDVKIGSVNQNGSNADQVLWKSPLVEQGQHLVRLVHASGSRAYLDVVQFYEDYEVRAGLLNDAGAWTDTSWYAMDDYWSAVEIKYVAFDNTGSLTLWLNGEQKQTLVPVDNDTRTLTEIRLGAQGIESDTRGTLYFDDFESRRFSYIGLLPDPGVYDPLGTNPAGWFTRTYQYDPAHPHAVDSITPESGSPDSYTYDDNGNMTCRVENGVTYTHTYNAENRASSIARRNGDCTTGTIIESWSFEYDGDGTRVSTAHFTGIGNPADSVTAYFMGGAYEITDGVARKYYSFAGMMVAVNDGTEVQYLLTDHLGSTVAITDSSGTLRYQQRYLPFGASRTVPNSPLVGTDFTYTGQRMLDPGMGGIMDYKARFYSPYIKRRMC